MPNPPFIRKSMVRIKSAHQSVFWCVSHGKSTCPSSPSAAVATTSISCNCTELRWDHSLRLSLRFLLRSPTSLLNPNEPKFNHRLSHRSGLPSELTSISPLLRPPRTASPLLHRRFLFRYPISSPKPDFSPKFHNQDEAKKIKIKIATLKRNKKTSQNQIVEDQMKIWT